MTRAAVSSTVPIGRSFGRAVPDRFPSAAELRVRALLDSLVAAIRVVVGADERGTLLAETCRALLDHGAFTMAWIGADEDGDGWLERLAVAGDTAGYTDGIRISTRDIPEGRGPTGTAVRTGRHDVCVDATTDQRMAPWRDRYLAAGTHTSAAFPLRSRSLPTAVLTIYADVAGSFGTDELAVLDDLASAIGFALDTLADRARSEAALKASASAMRSSLDEMIDPFVICSSVRGADGAIVDFRVDFANRAAGDFIGRAPETMMGAVLPERMMRLRDRWFFDVVREVVESSEALSEDGVAFVLPRPEGDQVDGEVNIQIAPFGDGFFAAWRDVTERERTLAALRASEMHARELIEDSADGILISDPDGRYVEANPAMCRMLGYSHEQLLTMHAGDLTAADDPIGNAGMRRRLAEPTGEAGILTERRYRRRDGTSVPVEVRFTKLSGGRQQRNVRDISERVAAEAEAAREMRIRAALTDAVQHTAVEASIEEAAHAICQVLTTLHGVDFATVDAFFGEDDVVMVAGAVPPGCPTHPGDSFPPERGRYLQARAQLGPWAEHWPTREDWGTWGEGVKRSGLRAVAYGPIVHGDHVEGVLGIGTSDADFARTLVEHMPGVVAFSATSSGLLGERLHARRLEVDMRRRIGRVLSDRSFHAVFQSIVDLTSGATVGYEALTRFDSGQRPDLFFADAWSVGLGPDLEIATLTAAIEAGRRLPSGRWLDLNVSPSLLKNPAPIEALLLTTGRPIVLEVTEHEVVDDYGAVRDWIRAPGRNVRLAVDDAGVGAANFGHIIELRPDFVKLDISIVRCVNADLGRQALVAGMCHFSRTSGCRIVAEGIETEEEAETLRSLGVEFGQGYLFGRPAPVEAWMPVKTKG
jgi:PAS domain S-box-containing protein